MKYRTDFSDSVTALLDSGSYRQIERTDNPYPAQTEGVRRCIAPWKKLFVDVSGDVRPNAHCLCTNVVGNLNKNTMEEIWNGKQMTAYRHAIVWQGLGKKCSLEALYGRMPHELLYGMSRSFPGRGRKAGLEPLRVIK